MQDFLKEVDLQFLDHMRRGTSINFADLASDPPPATMQVTLTLFMICINLCTWKKTCSTVVPALLCHALILSALSDQS